MTIPLRMALALFPLALYFFTLGVWQGGPRPRVVSGPRDFLLLAFGLGGLIAFGPVGQMAVSALFARPNVWSWLMVASFLGLLALAWLPRTRRRLVVYHVAPEDLQLALGLAMQDAVGPCARTVRGFEDPPSRRGVTLEAAPLWQSGSVEAYGEGPEALIEALRPVLALRLEPLPPRPSRLATLLFALAFATLLVPLAAAVLNLPGVMAALTGRRGG